MYCVCMYVCMYVLCMYALCMYVCMYVCMYAHSHVHSPVPHALQQLLPAVQVTHSTSNNSCGGGLFSFWESAQHPRFWKQGLWRIGCHHSTVVCTHAISTHWQDELNIYYQMLANEH